MEGNGEKGPANQRWACTDQMSQEECKTLQPVGSSNGTENLIRFDSDSNRFLGAEYWTAFNTDTFSNKTDLSNVPAASILLDYKKAVKTLTFTIGNSGQLNPWAVVGKNSRFFSIAMGDAVTAGDGLNPLVKSMMLSFPLRF